MAIDEQEAEIVKTILGPNTCQIEKGRGEAQKVSGKKILNGCWEASVSKSRILQTSPIYVLYVHLGGFGEGNHQCVFHGVYSPKGLSPYHPITQPKDLENNRLQSHTAVFEQNIQYMEVGNVDRKEHLKAIHYCRSAMTVKRVFDVIEEMKREEIPITFKSVSRMSGVSVGTLYYHHKIKTEIQRIRAEHRKSAPRRAHTAGIGTSRELYHEVRLLRRRIADLEEELKLNELLLDREYYYDLFGDEDNH